MSTVTPSPNVGVVGRESELATLVQALRGALSGTLHVVFIDGEAGIGKSTLLERTVDLARDSGFRVFLGEAAELEQGRPFRSIAEAMGCVGPQKDSRRAEIMRLLTGGSDIEAAFFPLIDGFDDLVEAEALQGPIVLAIDDLQWADPGTLGTLGSVSRRHSALPILIVGCLRLLPRSSELATLLRSTASVAQSISLGPLGEEAVQELARARVGGTPGPNLRGRLSHAGGTPFYVNELLESLLAESRISVASGEAEIDGEAGIGANAVATVLHRLSGLSPEDFEILRCGAILGSGFRIEDLAGVAGLPLAAVTHSVSQLRAHGVIGDVGERLRFRHDLIREAIYEDLGEPARRSMHRRAARALTDLGSPASAVAPHLIRGAVAGDVQAAATLIEASSAPGIDARSATALLEAALDIHPEHPHRAALVSRWAVLLSWQSRAGEAIPRLLSLIAQTPDGAARLQLMVRLGSACHSSERFTEARAWRQRASTLAGELVHSGDTSELLHAAEALFVGPFLGGEPERGLALSERAAEQARGTGKPVEAEANDQCSWMSTMLLRSTAALRFSETALSIPAGASSALFWRHHAWALADLDQIEAAESAMVVASALAERNGLVRVLHEMVIEAAWLKFAMGRWDDALLEVRTAGMIADEFGPGDLGPADDLAAWIHYRRTDEQNEFAGLPNETPTSCLLSATVLLEAGDLDGASKIARERVEVSRVVIPGVGRHRIFESLPALARISLAAGDSESAQLARDTAMELAQDSEVPSVQLAAARCSSLVDADPVAARRVAQLARLSPRKVIRAEALEDAATALESDEALGALIEARDLYLSIGATRDQNRVGARLAELDAAPAVQPRTGRAKVGWDALTPAELEVVRLAAEGLTNREIGSRLHVSHRTVAFHLSNVFGKLGLRSRVALAREAARHLPQ